MSYVWLPVDVNLFQNHKTARLSRSLGCPRVHAIGYLVCLWSWASVHAPDGNLQHLDADDIAVAAGWEGDLEVFAPALIRAGFMDEDHTLHDWEEHQGASFRKRLSEAEKKRAKRGTREGQQGDSKGTGGGQEGDSKGTESDERTGEDRKGEEEEGTHPLAVFASGEIESESVAADYERVVRDGLARGLSVNQIETTIVELADWWPANRKKRRDAHRTLRVWLNREEPKRDPPTEPTYPDIVVPEDWS